MGSPSEGLKAFQAAAAIHAAKAPKCPRHSGYWAIRTDTEEPEASGIRCKSRRCPWCSRFVAIASYVVLADGIAKAQADGRRVRLITLTDTAEGAGTVQSFYASWQRLALRLNRRGLLGEYARILEVTQRGKLHVHALMADADRGGGFIPQRQLSELAAASGFGKIADIRQVSEIEVCSSLPAYLTGSLNAETTKLVRYGLKQSAERLAELGAGRLRPLSLSRSWPGGGIRAAEADLMHHWYGKAEGTWEVWNEHDLQLPLRRLRQAKFSAEVLRERQAVAELLAVS